MPFKSPTRAPAADIHARVWGGVDNAEQVNGTIASHDNGQFAASGMLIDACLQDDRILSLYYRRTAGLSCRPRIIKPAAQSLKARKLAELLGGNEDGGIGKFDEYFPPAILKEILGWGIFAGAVAVQKVWNTKRSPWAPRLVPWHPQFLRWDHSESRFYIVTLNRGEVRLPTPEEDDPEWFVWTPYGFKYGWRRAVIRAIAKKYLSRTWNDRDWSRYCEVHGLAIRKAKYPAAEQSKDKIRRFTDDVAMLGSDTMIELPVGDKDKAGYDVELLEAQAKTYEAFKDQRAEINQDLGILLLGENDTTGGAADAGGAGSFASKKVSVGISDEKAKEDAELGVGLRTHVLRQWAYYEKGDEDLAPYVTWQTEAPEDDQQRATTLGAVGDSVSKLKASFGDRLDEDALAERFKIPLTMSKEQWDKVKPAPVGPDGMPLPGGPGGPAPSDGDGGEEPAEDAAPDEKADDKETAKLSVFTPVARREFQGLPIAIENPAGSFRMWYDAEANRGGYTEMLFDYGFIEGHLSGDGEELDCYLGPDEGASDVHIVHQKKAPDFKGWDEDKVMLGFADAGQAKAAFLAHRDDGDRAYGGMTVVPLDVFKAKLERRTGQRKIRATADAAAKVVMAALSAVSPPPRAKLLYSELVAQSAVPAMVRAMTPFRMQILKATKGESPEAIRAALVEKFKDFDASKAANVAFRARMMAHAGGAATVHEEDKRGGE